VKRKESGENIQEDMEVSEVSLLSPAQKKSTKKQKVK
jgi:hypothetical protein